MRRIRATLRSIPTAVRWGAAAGFATVIVFLSLTPDRYRPGDGVFHWLVAATKTPVQKALHVVAYAVLTLLLVWALETIRSTGKRLLLAVFIAVAFGASLEWMQLHVPGRFGTLYDVGLNGIGALLGLAFARTLGRSS